MFRKIVTELAYSPALAGNLGNFIKQMRDETSRRQMGLVFILLAVAAQLFSAAFPPESTNANNPAVFIDGGMQSIDDYLAHYDQNTGTVRDLLTSLGVARSDIEAMQQTSLPENKAGFIWSMQNPRTDNTNAHFFAAVNQKQGVAYYWPTELIPETPTYTGSSSALGGWFALTSDGASLITQNPAPSPCATWISSPGAPLMADSWLRDPSCLDQIELTLSVREVSSSALTVETLRASNRLAYTLSIKNETDLAVNATPAINLEDILEYTRILDYGGGSYDYDTKNLSWPASSIPANGSRKVTFIVQALPTIPSTARGQHVDASYDCSISASFGNTTVVPVDCPPTKHVEMLVNQLPKVSGLTGSIAAVILLALVIFLYIRSRQLLAELYVIRHNHLGGL